jgi:pyruvate/2-oxoglutarate dehydrogenase complex dihydrolipoamide dehydrogenase (E3) component
LDLCVIGAGSAGCAAALTGAALGAATAVVEAEAPGGERVAYDAPFAVWREAARAAAHGGGATDWAAIAARAAAAARRVATSASAERLRAAGVTVIAGRGRFLDRRTLAVGTTTLRARRFIIATGRSLKAPSAPGLDLLHGLSPAQALTLTQAPSRVAILGAGGTGLALAQIFARLGAPVVAIEPGQALAGLGREFAEPALRRLSAEGVRLLEGVQIASVDPIGAGPGARLTLADGERIEASHLVFASGFRPALEGLGLETTGARVDASGVAARRDLSTGVAGLSVAGAAAAGGAPDAEAAARQGRLAARAALLGLKGDAQFAAAPRLTPLDPEIIEIGLSEAQARAAGETAHVLRATLGEDEAALAAGREDGHVALVTDARGALIGATLVGADARAAAAALAAAIARRMDVGGLAELPLPGFGGIAALTRAAGVALARRARSPAAARLLRWRRLWR